MKRYHSPHEQPRFHGNLRHYHRFGSQPQRSWDDWVGAKASNTASWTKIVGIVAVVLILGAVVTGLIFGLR